MKRSFLASLVAVAFSSLTLVACAVQSDESTGDDLSEDGSGSSEEAVTTTITATEFSDPNADVPTTPAHRIFTSARSYRLYFGNDAPPSVDFNKSWVAFYGAGMKTSGGYVASIPSVSRSLSGKTIKITTSLSSPGPDCMVTMAITNPHVFVKFPKQPSALYVSYTAKDVIKSCGPACNGAAQKNPTTGACECTALGKCITGSQWNASPEVCGCMSLCATVKCGGGTHCEATGNAVGCVPDANPCAVMRCMQGTTCTPDANGTTAQCVRNPGGCTQDADCVLYDNYCGGCACDALGYNHKPVTCSNPVQCLREPCAGVTVKCEAGLCVKH